jgi:hypothetical protein
MELNRLQVCSDEPGAEKEQAAKGVGLVLGTISFLP